MADSGNKLNSYQEIYP